MKKCMCCMCDYREEEQECPVCGYSEEQMRRTQEEFPEALKPETILGGRFILGRVLSATDFSVIYISWDALLQRRVAIREYFPAGLGIRKTGTTEICFRTAREQQSFERGRKIFEQEAQGLSENQDIEGIIHIYRILRENQTSYIVMQYLEGWTLRDELNEKGTLERHRAEDIVCGIAQILDLLHQRGIRHFNLAPENIYLDENENVRIIDFGKAKCEVYQILRKKADILNQRYTAWEVLHGESADDSADMYSLGAIYYRMLTGKEPPQKKTWRKKKAGLKVKDFHAGPVIQAMTVSNPQIRLSEIPERLKV